MQPPTILTYLSKGSSATRTHAVDVTTCQDETIFGSATYCNLPIVEPERWLEEAGVHLTCQNCRRVLQRRELDAALRELHVIPTF